MEPINLAVPGTEILFNSLYATKDPAFLAQDLAVVKLPDGSFIDIGWYPQFDPDGCLKITHFSEDWSERLGVVTTRDIDKVEAIIRLFIAE